MFFDSVGNSIYTISYSNPNYFVPKTAIYLTNEEAVYFAGVYYPVTNNNYSGKKSTYIAVCIKENYDILLYTAIGDDYNLSKQEEFYKLTWTEIKNLNYSLTNK